MMDIGAPISLDKLVLYQKRLPGFIDTHVGNNLRRVVHFE